MSAVFYVLLFTLSTAGSFCVSYIVAVMEISAGFHQVKIGDRGGRRRDFHDVGINTRETMEHVKASKCGM